MAHNDSGQNRLESARTGAYRYGESFLTTAARERRELGGISRDLAGAFLADSA
jgi:hypothetical protein